MNTELNLTAPQLKAVIGVLIIMGMNVLPSMILYWSEDDNFHHSKIAHIMTVKRYYLLNCCIVNSCICYKYNKNSKKEK